MPPKFLIIGAGSRGNAYARAITTSTTGSVYAVAEPDPYKRRSFGQEYIWGKAGDGKPKPGQEFSDWREWLAYYTTTSTNSNNQNDKVNDGARIDGVIICTLDETHIDILLALARANLRLHILCEKPLALSLADCLSIYAAYKDTGTVFSIGHVLRYSPHNLLLRRLVRDQRVIGDVVSIEHAEPVGNWHFAHSYVRGNWRRETPVGDGSLLTKSCHDLDFILWLVDYDYYYSGSYSGSSTASGTTGSGDEGEGKGRKKEKKKEIRSISSSGRLTQFRRGAKPVGAGSATNCLSCAAEPDCAYSALRIYRDMHLRRGITDWPVNIVCPDIEEIGRTTKTKEEQERYLLAKLGEDYDGSTMSAEEVAGRPWYGRCVYEADNNVCDDQVVTITWSDEGEDSQDNKGKGKESGTTALFHMIAPTEKQCERRGRIYGTLGELEYDSRTISFFSFDTRETTTIQVPKRPPEEEKAHGGGDYGLARGFVEAVEKVVEDGWEVGKAQRDFVGCTLEDVIKSHAVVFAAEEARREEKVVKWKEWWEGKLASL